MPTTTILKSRSIAFYVLIAEWAKWDNIEIKGINRKFDPDDDFLYSKDEPEDNLSRIGREDFRELHIRSTIRSLQELLQKILASDTFEEYCLPEVKNIRLLVESISNINDTKSNKLDKESSKLLKTTIKHINEIGIINQLNPANPTDHHWSFKLKVWFDPYIGIEWFEKYYDDWEEKQKKKEENKFFARKSAELFGFEEAPNLNKFYGRSKLLKQLKEKIINSQSKIVVLWGAFGIGKTCFAKRLSDEVVDNFDYIVWTRINCSLPVEQFLKEKIFVNFLFAQQAFELDYVSRFIKLLNQHKVLIVIDGFDELKEGDNNIYKQYLTFLEKVEQSNHKSCIVVTSQGKPQTTAKFYNYQLMGLDREAIASLLEDKRIDSPHKKIKSLKDRYRGNPLLIRMCCDTIKKHYSGNIKNFLDNTTYQPQNFVELLDWQFENLSEAEKAICYWLAIEGDKVSFDNLKTRACRFSSNSTNAFIRAIENLEDKSIIYCQQNYYLVAPTVRRYIIDNLLEKVKKELNLLLHSQNFKELLLSDEISFLLKYRLLLKNDQDEQLKISQERRILKPLIEFRNRNELNFIVDELKKINIAEKKTGYLMDNLSLLNKDNIQKLEDNDLKILDCILCNKLEFEDILRDYSNKLNKDFYLKMQQDVKSYFTLEKIDNINFYANNLKIFCDLLTDKIEQYEENNKKYKIEIAIKGYKIIYNLLQNESIIESIDKDFLTSKKDVCYKLGTLYERRIKEHKTRNQNKANEYFEKSRKL